MIKLLEWIRRHKVIAGLICLCLFAIPLVVVHILFKIENGPAWLQTKWDAGDVLAYVAGFEAFLGTVSLGALSLWQNEQAHREHIESLEPCLSMKLLSINGFLNLIVENTGAVEAKDILITVLEICNNGDNNSLMNDGVFSPPFELFPKEMIQREVALSGASINNSINPQIRIHVSYLRPDINRKKEYERTVSFDAGYDKQIIANVEYDNQKAENDVDRIARAAVRIANYLDGHQLAKFDEIDLLAGTSLRNDLVEAAKTKEKVSVVDREQTIKKRLRRGNKNDA